MRNILIAAIFLGLSACGGGGGADGPTPTTPSPPPVSPGDRPPASTDGFLSFDKTALKLQGFSDNIAPPKASLRVTTKDVINQEVSVRIDSSGLDIDEIYVNRIDERNYNVQVRFKNNLPPGEHQGYLDVILCKDATAACTQPYGDGPSRLTYSIKVSPASDLKPLKKFADLSWSGPNGDWMNARYIDAALETKDITKRWQYIFPDNEGFYQTRTIGGRVFVLTGIVAPWGTIIGSNLRAFDDRTGALLWENKLDYYAQSLKVYRDEIFIANEKHLVIHKFNPENGFKTDINVGQFSTYVDKVENIEPYNDGYLATHRQQKPNAWNTSANSYNAVFYKNSNGQTWAKTGYYAIDAEDVDSPTTFLTANSIIYTRVLSNNNEYGILALSAKDGSEKFFARTPALYVGAPFFMVGDNICSIARAMQISCFDKITGQEKWSAVESGLMAAASAKSLLISDGEYANWRNAKTGELEFSAGVPMKDSTTYNKNDILMFNDIAFINSTWELRAIRKGSKEVVWSYSVPSHNLALSENGVLFAISERRLVAFNLQ